MNRRPEQRIYLSAPYQSGNEIDLLREVLDSNWLAPTGPHIRQFEQLLEDTFDYPHVVAVSSGTAALHLILRVLGVQAGDRVLVSDLTFIGGVNPISYLGAEAVLIDSEADSWNMSPQLLENYLIQHEDHLPKAVVLVHIFGVPARVKEIRKICNRYGIYLIEDCAEALGATVGGSSVGKDGHFSFLSFNGNKMITTSGGGAVLAPDAESAARILYLATQAKTEADHYDHAEMGYNYRMSNLLAALGVAQLQQFAFRLQRKCEINALYRKKLGEDLMTFQGKKTQEGACYWLTCGLLTSERITPGRLSILLDEHYNVEARRIWKPMHLQPLYQNCHAVLSGQSEQLFETGICLPSGVGMTDEQVEFVSDAIIKILDNL